jgi:hypothetical protein
MNGMCIRSQHSTAKCVDTFGEPHLPTPHSGFVRMSTALLTSMASAESFAKLAFGRRICRWNFP